MKLFIVRHGKTTHNELGIIQGTGVEGELSDLGIEQATVAAQQLQNETFDRIISSDLNRCKQTADIIGKHHTDNQIEYTPTLRERCAGVFDGQHKKHYYDAIEVSPLSWQSYRPENGESQLDLIQRVGDFHTKLFKKHYGEKILAVSHGAFISAWLLHAQGKSMNRENFVGVHPLNCSISKMEFDEQGKLIDIHMGKTDH